MFRITVFLFLSVVLFSSYLVEVKQVVGAEQIDKVYVVKSKRQLYLMSNNRIVKTYTVGLGQQPIGHKQQRGDSRTPEGKYLIDYRNPKSRFHLSLHINYPSHIDRRRAWSQGVSPGGDIFIHGLPNGMEDAGGLFRQSDWTDGCIAVSNEAIQEIWRTVKNGTPIEIVP